MVCVSAVDVDATSGGNRQCKIARNPVVNATGLSVVRKHYSMARFDVRVLLGGFVRVGCRKGMIQANLGTCVAAVCLGLAAPPRPAARE